MAVSPSELHAIPLFHGITVPHLAELVGAFERLSFEAGETLFEAGSAPTHLFLLVRGEVALREPGQDGEPRFRLSPLAPIGELGAVTGLPRATTAVTTQPSEIWRISVPALTEFFEKNGDVAFPFYHNLLSIVTNKVRRDRKRIEEMRGNLIRTQKAMKRLLDLVLETEETPLSKQIAETLEDLIEHNKRGHYLVEPTRTLTSTVRLDSGDSVPVLELSDGLLRIGKPPSAPAKGAHWSGVLVTPGAAPAASREVAVSGTVEALDESGMIVRLDLLIDAYAAVLRDYLTRVQMLDFLV
jgi:CRP/FNR family transcriptional regulator, cyclic AMP receptor protein